MGAGADVRGQYGATAFEKRVVCRWRFLVEDIGAIAQNALFIQRLSQRDAIDQLPARAVEKDEVAFTKFQTLRIDEAFRLSREVHVKREDVAAGNEVVDILNTLHSMLGGKIFVPVNVKAQYPHSKGPRPDGNLFANAPKTGDADRLAHKFISCEPLPTPGVDGVRLLDDIPINGKEQPKGVFSDRGMIHSRTKCDWNLQVGRGDDGHFI